MNAAAAAPEVIEGTWEEIVREAHRFKGRRLRVAILPNGERHEDTRPGTQNAPSGLTITLPPTGRYAARLSERLAAEATNDPEEIRKAQEELDEMMRSMNEERIRSGAEPIF